MKLGVLTLTYGILTANFMCIHILFVDAGFHYYVSPKTWRSAVDMCYQHGQRLVKVDTEDKRSRLKAYARSLQTFNYNDFWIGLKLRHYDLPTQVYTYKFVDDTTASYLPWKAGEPNLRLIEECIRLTPDTLHFQTTSCSKTHRFFCEDVSDPLISNTEATTYATEDMETTTHTNSSQTSLTETTVGPTISDDEGPVTISTDTTAFQTLSTTFSASKFLSTDTPSTLGISMETEDPLSKTSVEPTTTMIFSSTMTMETDSVTSTIASPLITMSANDTCTLDSCLPNGCNCNPVNLSDPVVIAMLKIKIATLRESLLLDKKNLTMYTTTKKSAGDDRVSSKFTGAAGAIMLLVAASIIVIPDVVAFVTFIYRE